MERNLRECYDLLGVNPGASQSQLRTAFRSLARRLHPDLNPEHPGSLDRFIQIRRAYELLMARPGLEEGEKDGQAEIPWRLIRIEKNGLDVIYHLEIDPARVLVGGRLTLPLRRWERCPECWGRGRTVDWSWARLTPVTKACDRCASKGLVRRVGELAVRLPRGSRIGTRLRLAGKGDQARFDGPKGDLLLSIQADPEGRPGNGEREAR